MAVTMISQSLCAFLKCACACYEVSEDATQGVLGLAKVQHPPLENTSFPLENSTGIFKGEIVFSRGAPLENGPPSLKITPLKIQASPLKIPVLFSRGTLVFSRGAPLENAIPSREDSICCLKRF